MNPLGKEQDKIFEHLEKGNFIAPPGGDPRDEEDIPMLKRSFALLIPGLALSVLLPGLFDSAELFAFLGALLLAIGAGRLTGEDRWFHGVVICAVLQAMLLAFVLVAQTSVPALMESIGYTVAGYGALALGFTVTALQMVAIWSCFPKCKLPTVLLSVSALVATAATVFLPGLFLLRLIAVIPGLAALVWLAILACKQ